MESWPDKAKIILCLILVVAILGVIGCGRNGDVGRNNISAFSPNEEDPQWVSRDPNKPAKIAVVFVHGIFGSTKGTWTNENGVTFFQLLKADPEVGSHIDIYAFGFASKMFGGVGSLDIREGANKLKTYLSDAHVVDYQAVVLIGHSMGGLVLLRYLASNLQKDGILANKVPLVVLYGSPQEGAQIAAVATLALSNPGLAHMTPVDDNQWLQQLNDDWVGLAHKPQVVCGYEKAPTFGEVIVPWSSSTRFCTEAGIPIDGANHINMVKPDRQTHPSVVLLTDALKRHVLPKQFGGRLETPDFVNMGNDWHFVMDTVAKSARILNSGTAYFKYWIDGKSNSALYIIPDEGPATVPGNGIQNIKFFLLANAKATRYSFLLKTSIDENKHVVVEIPDLDQLRKQSAALSQNILSDLNKHLADLESGPTDASPEKKSLDALAAVAYGTVEKSLPDLPIASRWVIAADALSAASLNKVALQALRRVEAVSGDAVRSTSVQDIAARVQIKTGEEIFRKVPLPVTPKRQSTIEFTRPSSSKNEVTAETAMPYIFTSNTSSARTALELAERMKRTPSLAGSGIALEGEAKGAINESRASDMVLKRSAAIK